MAEKVFLVETAVLVERARIAELIPYLVPREEKRDVYSRWQLTGTGIKLVERNPFDGRWKTVRLYTFVPLGGQARVVIEAPYILDSNRWIQAFQRRRFENNERRLCLRLVGLAKEYREAVVSRDRKDAERIVDQLQSGLEIR